MNNPSCKFRLMLPLLLGLLATSGLAQPGLIPCDGLNHLSTNANPVTLVSGEQLAVQFVPSQSLVAYGLEHWSVGSAIGITGGGDFFIHLQDPTTSLPSAAAIAHGHAPPGFVSGGWSGAFFNEAVYLRANVPYWLVYSSLGILGPDVIGSEDTPPGPHTVISTRSLAGGAWSPQTTANQFKFRVMSISCTAPTTPAAAVTSPGAGCPGTGGLSPTLSTTALPGLGEQNFALQVASLAANTPVLIFWTTAGTATGVDVGSNCFLYLDPVQLLATMGMGFNPLFSGTTDASGLFTLNLPVPHSTGIAGAQFWMQAVVLDANGPVIAGQSMAFTNAMRLTIGY